MPSRRKPSTPRKPRVKDDLEPLAELARQLAGVADATQLLDMLCEAAATQCHGSGAAVARSSGDDGEIVSATGPFRVALNKPFPLRGSLVREVIRTRDIVTVEDYSERPRPLGRAVPQIRLGPVLLAPLIAHESLRGVLIVARNVGAAAFTPTESKRLRVIADHAALAVWKTELLEQAQAADQAKSRFLATISHELRTPLTALAGYEELLSDEVLGPLSDAQADVLERMRSVTQHLTAVIEEVLAFSSVEAGREVVRPTDFLAADLVRAVAAVVEPLAKQKHLTLKSRIANDGIRMTSDVDKVRQIIVNLAGNAVKFTDAGTVEIGVEPAGNEVCFIVRDSGIGIADEDLAALFKPFSQLDTSLTRRHGGTGLGLYISRRLADLLHGRIAVQSEAGKGSEFRVFLPTD